MSKLMNVIGSNHCSIRDDSQNDTKDIIRRIEMRSSHAFSNFKIKK
jgi:hypothetical protein